MKLLLVIMNGQKSNLNCRFKLEPITTYHIWFIIKKKKNCECSTFFFILKKLKKWANDKLMNNNK